MASDGRTRKAHGVSMAGRPVFKLAALLLALALSPAVAKTNRGSSAARSSPTAGFIAVPVNTRGVGSSSSSSSSSSTSSSSRSSRKNGQQQQQQQQSLHSAKRNVPGCPEMTSGRKGGSTMTPMMMCSSSTSSDGGGGGGGAQAGVAEAEGVTRQGQQEAAAGGGGGLEMPRTGAEEKREAAKSALLGVFGEVSPNLDDMLVKMGGRGQEEGSGESLPLPTASAEAVVVDPILVCPSTLGDLTEGFRSFGGVGPGALSVSYKSSEKLPGTRYERGPVFIDFAEAVKPAWQLNRELAIKEGTFQSPMTSWLYERGWRQSFSANGFPGIDEEFRQVKEFFASTGSEGGAVIDLSCGSGLMMRKLVASKSYSRVIGGDLSPTMLTETARRFKKEELGTPELIRCDVSKLPLKTESLDGVHAGAALHCWTRLEESLSEVHRVLKPGKGFFATTFLTSASLRKTQQGDGFKFFELDELERLMLGAGFEKVEVSQNGLACAIVRATKSPEE